MADGRIAVTRAAPAKANLFLKVVRRLPNGYHELYSLFVLISLADSIELRLPPKGERARGEARGGDIEDIIAASFPDPLFTGRPDALFASGDNLVLRAIRLFREKTGFPAGPVEVNLVKKIPMGGGLGGGSSDAAAALLALRDYYAPHLGRETLMEWGLALGADLPFFLGGEPLALVGGVGEKARPYDGPPPPRGIMLLGPGKPLSTARVFQAYGEIALTKKGAESSIDGAGERKGDGNGAASRPASVLFGENDLFPAAVKLMPELLEGWRFLRRRPAEARGMTGSGPTLWALFPDRLDALQSALQASALLTREGLPFEARSFELGSPASPGA
ncbi:MAG: hypothetical protein LBO66_06315 [Deltaproteobacteria bacterium]|nr:hypothetical protein [Deltaproteobacteria bacterium]